MTEGLGPLGGASVGSDTVFGRVVAMRLETDNRRELVLTVRISLGADGFEKLQAFACDLMSKGGLERVFVVERLECIEDGIALIKLRGPWPKRHREIHNA